MSELVQFLLVKDQKKIPIKRAGMFRGAPFHGVWTPKAFLAVGSSELPAPSAVPCLFPVDIQKHVIREYKDYKDVYSEIVNRAGRTLQEVGGAR